MIKKVDINDLGQCHEMMRLTYLNRIRKKYEEIQGVQIKSLNDFNEDGRYEVRKIYDEFPMDDESLQRILDDRRLYDF
jgi:hypothetical protein